MRFRGAAQPARLCLLCSPALRSWAPFTCCRSHLEHPAELGPGTSPPPALLLHAMMGSPPETSPVMLLLGSPSLLPRAVGWSTAEPCLSQEPFPPTAARARCQERGQCQQDPTDLLEAGLVSLTGLAGSSSVDVDDSRFRCLRRRSLCCSSSSSRVLCLARLFERKHKDMGRLRPFMGTLKPRCQPRKELLHSQQGQGADRSHLAGGEGLPA